MAGLFSRLKSALSKTSHRIGEGIEHIFIKKHLDEESLRDLEELLISFDVGTLTSSRIIEQLRKLKFSTETTAQEIKATLASIITKSLDQVAHDFDIENGGELQVVLVCGVNGNGKTTSIGKLASLYRSMGKSVAVAACDTYRAAATEQLENWTERAGVPIYKGAEKADPASVAHRAVSESQANGTDILFIDTAGRLHNQKNLMEELAKIIRVITKIAPAAPQHTLLVVDATTGQNVYTQTEQFKEIANISGLVITKLDGTAKAGAVIGVVDRYKLPVHFIGIGEGIADLKPFNSASFAKALVDMD